MLAKIAYGDWKTKHITDRQLVFVILLGVVGLWVITEITILQRIVGSFIISIPLLLLACIAKGSIGGGDIKLMAAGGFLLGTEGIWHAFSIGVMACGLFVMVLLLIQKANKKTEIALGTFLCAGMMLVLYGI